MLSNYDIILDKINAYIKKYYSNELIKGFIFFSAISLFLFLSIGFLEHFGRFGNNIRAILFFVFIASVFFGGIKYLFLPLWFLFRLDKAMPHKNAAKLIGSHFGEIGDSLLNVLQLNNSKKETTDLILASIDQKAKKLSPFVFSSAINFSSNKKHLPFLLVPVFICFILGLTGNSKIVAEGVERVVSYNSSFVPTAPFRFVLNQDLFCVQGDDYKINLLLEGESVPKDIFIKWENGVFPLNKASLGQYSYLFKNIKKDTRFSFSGGGFSSSEYVVQVFPKPVLLEQVLSVFPPNYTQKPPFFIKNTGNISVPEGSVVSWSFKAKNTSEIYLGIGNAEHYLPTKNNVAFFEKSFFKKTPYFISLKNEKTGHIDSVLYKIDVVKDRFPSIFVESVVDSTQTDVLFFTGQISDDYGFSSLLFQYRFLGEQATWDSLEIEPSSSFFQFFHSLDLISLGLEPGVSLECFFVVKDNDKINGPKKTTSSVFQFSAPTKQDLLKEQNNLNKKINETIRNASALSKKISKKLNNNNNNNNAWNTKKELSSLLELYNQLEKNINRVSSLFNEHKNNPWDPKNDLLKKKEEINSLLEELLPEEMKSLLQELEDLVNNFDKNELKKKLEELSFNNDLLSKDLERNLELLKQLDFEESLMNAISSLEEQLKKQLSLKQKTNIRSSKEDSLSFVQKNLFDEFEKERENLESLFEKNKELFSPANLPKKDSLAESISREMNSSKKSLDGGKKKKSIGHQENATEDLSEMISSLKKTQNNMQMTQAIENIEDLRLLLENVLLFSFEQESLVLDFQKINANNPLYFSLLQQQYKLSDDVEIIQDSLFSLSKRITQLEPIVLKEIASITETLSSSNKNLQEKNIKKGNVSQQKTMVSSNNLALLLEDLLASLQKDLSEKMPGQQSCQKPGGAGGSEILKLKKMQEKLGQEIGRYKKNKGNNGEGLGQMLAKQEAIRLELEKLANKLGPKASSFLDETIKKLKENEFDIMNNKISFETIKRQEAILSKLLESEKAEKEKEQDEKRESIEPGFVFKKPPPVYFEKSFLESQNELFKPTPPSFSSFYKKRVAAYFNSLFNE